MTLNDKSKIVIQYVEKHRQASNFISQIPTQISQAFFENDAITAYYDLVDILTIQLLGETWKEWIDWYVFDLDFGNRGPGACMINGVEYSVKSVDDLLKVLSLVE